MNIGVRVATVLPLLAIGFSADLGRGKQIPLRSQEEIKNSCKDSGGITFPKTGPTSRYGCINKDGSGIVCGGATENERKTCDTFLVMPPRLPTRDEVHYAETAEAEKTEEVQQK
jgi:hypothetical protein